VVLQESLGIFNPYASNQIAQGVQQIPPAYSLAFWQTPGPGEVEAEYRRLLVPWTVKEMRELAAHRGIALSGLKRDGIFENLVKALILEENLTAALERLPADSRATLALVCILGNSFLKLHPVDALLPYLDAALSARTSTGTLRSAGLCVEELLKLGLVFQLQNPLVIPVQVLARRMVIPELFTTYSGAISREEKIYPGHFSHMAIALAFLGRSGVLVVERTPRSVQENSAQKPNSKPATSEPTLLVENSLKKASRLLHHSEAWIDFTAQTLDAAGFWIDHNPRELTMKLVEWLQKVPTDQDRSLFKMVAGLPSFFEFQAAAEEAHFSTNRPNPYLLSPQQYADALALGRIRLIDLLARAPAGRWLAIMPLLQVLHGLHPYPFSEPDLRRLSSGKKVKDEALPWTIKAGSKSVDWLDFNEWAATFGVFYLKVLTHTLARFGLIDIGWQGSKPVALRMTEYGETLLERRPDYALMPLAQNGPALWFTPGEGFSISLEEANSELINLLLMISTPLEPAETASNGAKSVNDKKAGSRPPAARTGDHLSIGIVKNGMQYAFNSGWSLEKIVSVLEKNLGMPLPREMRQAFDSLWEHNGRLYVYQDMALVELADDYALPELLASTSLNQILLYAFSPRVIAVNPQGVDRWLTELQTKGYTPKVVGASHD
jgi:hypothetical protein